MRKIPTLFTRVFENHKIVDILPQITPGCEEAFMNGKATVKFDGSCCAVIDGHFYKRYDAKQGKTPPAGAIPCCNPDPVTGHWPHWVEVDVNNSGDKWFKEAAKNYVIDSCRVAEIEPGTYEAVGPHFNANPHNLGADTLIPHGAIKVDVKRDFDSIKEWLDIHNEEGLVFWLDGKPVCKIKRSDFGMKWPVK